MHLRIFKMSSLLSENVERGCIVIGGGCWSPNLKSEF
jgi:hypothetical protein